LYKIKAERKYEGKIEVKEKEAEGIKERMDKRRQTEGGEK
jgi:hypothetical protein